MPAVPLALAEIEDRLEEIRYLLNRRSLVSVLAPLLGIWAGLAALLVWTAARATSESFSIALFAVVAAAAILLVRSGLALRRRWLSLPDTARLADERAGLQERLSTALWLAHAEIRPEMTPLLIADTFDRRSSWQTSVIAPRRFPFEVGYLVGGLLALAAAFFLAERPPESIALPVKAPHAIPERAPNAPPQQRPSGGGDDSLLDAANGVAVGIGDSDGSEPKKKIAALSEKMRGAIREALQRGDQVGPTQGQPRRKPRSNDLPETDLPAEPGLFDVAKSKQAGSEGPQAESGAAGNRGPEALRGSAPQGENPPGMSEDDGGKGAAEGKGEPGDDGAGARAPHGRPPTDGADKFKDPKRPGEGTQFKAGGEGAPESGKDMAQSPQEGKGTGGSEKDKPGEIARAGQPGRDKPEAGAKGEGASQAGGQGARGGANPAPGSGTDPGGLFAAKGSAGTQVTRPATAGSFKLTLGSFLASAPATEEKPKARERVGVQGSRAAVTEPPSLNPNQTADDTLRRADIPPEYEDIVRRIYSARPAK